MGHFRVGVTLGTTVKPLARHAALNNFVPLCHSLGVDPATLMRDAGLDPASLNLQDRWVSAAAIAHLLEATSLASGHDGVGLDLAGMRTLSHLGPLGLAIRDEPDVRSALGTLMRHERMVNESLRTTLIERGGIAEVRVMLHLGVPGEFRQAVDLAVGVLRGLLSGFLGAGWAPLAVTLSRPAPTDPTRHRRALGPDVRFGQDHNAVLLYSRDLDAPNAMAAPDMRAYVHRLLDGIDPSTESTFRERVLEHIEVLLPTGRCSAEQVARGLGVDRRTVHRRLTEQGTSFSSVLREVRVDLATHLVAGRARSFTDISTMLGFSSPASFSRWFRQEFGTTPRQWRRADQ